MRLIVDDGQIGWFGWTVMGGSSSQQKGRLVDFPNFFRGGYNKPSYFLGTKTLKLHLFHFENRCNIFGSQPGGVPWTKRVVLVLFIKTGTGRGVFYLFKDADVVIILVFFLGCQAAK